MPLSKRPELLHKGSVRDDFRDRSHLSILDGDRPADKPRAGKRHGIAEDEQVTCWQCLKDVGIETSMVSEVTIAPRRSPEGKKIGGSKAYVCTYCLGRGKVTKLIG